jgi:hypothetical protein
LTLSFPQDGDNLEISGVVTVKLVDINKPLLFQPLQGDLKTEFRGPKATLVVAALTSSLNTSFRLVFEIKFTNGTTTETQIVQTEPFQIVSHAKFTK